MVVTVWGLVTLVVAVCKPGCNLFNDTGYFLFRQQKHRREVFIKLATLTKICN
jgi:hypothetical protein